MGSVQWLDQARGIILLKMTEGETMDEIMVDMRTFSKMLNETPGKTYTIVDFLELRSVPGHSMGYFPEMARLIPSGEKRSEVIALVSQRTLVTMITEIFAKVYPSFNENFVYFNSVAQALDFIEEHIRNSAA